MKEVGAPETRLRRKQLPGLLKALQISADRK
jgi:hypothetical protein